MSTATQAIIMAAGFGNRMRPVTDTTPKPLVLVHGVPMLETTIRLLRQAGIEDIYIVTGHLASAFSYLPAQYPGVHLIHNPDYSNGNNITSLYHARAHLNCDTIIMDGDLIVANPQILEPTFSRSCYCCMEMTVDDSEWIAECENGIIKNCITQGGSGWVLRGISFWRKEDALRMGRQLTEAYKTAKLRNTFWDHIPLLLHPGDYQLGIRPICTTDLIEIDTLEELCRIDPTYLPRYKEENSDGN